MMQLACERGPIALGIVSGDLSSISLGPPQIFLVGWTVNALGYAYSCGRKNINMFSAFLGRRLFI